MKGKQKMKDFMIAAVIQKSPTEFYVNGVSVWDSNVNRAVLFTPNQVLAKVEELRSKNPTDKAAYVIQDRHFNYYDGKDFVFNLIEAKFYSLKEAEAVIKKLTEE
jgi:hypothetical protein